MTPPQIEAMDQCLRLLTTAVSTAGLYNAEHPQVLRLCTAAREKLNVVIGEAQNISVMRIDDKWRWTGSP